VRKVSSDDSDDDDGNDDDHDDDEKFTTPRADIYKVESNSDEI
jgi:hypothetical protein